MQETKPVLIFPDMAANWLKVNKGNRRIRKGVVDNYSAMMSSGEWKLTHQGIAIGEDGTLLDGQHRLLALIDSQVPVWMNVTTNVPKSSYPYFDQGIKRTMEDALNEKKTYVEVANLFFKLIFDLSNKASPQEVRSMISLLAEWLIKLDEIGKGNKAKIICSVGSRGAAIAAAMLGNVKNPDYSFRLYNQLTKGNTTELPTIAAALVKQLLIGEFKVSSITLSGSGYQLFVFFKMLSVFDEKNKHLKRIPSLDDQQKLIIRQNLKQRLLANASIESLFSIHASPGTSRLEKGKDGAELRMP